jgi:ribosomal-protein-alanine acetyltransferase
MIVDVNVIDKETIINQLAIIERELFDAQVWDEDMIREELSAPDRCYIAAIEDTYSDGKRIVTPSVAGISVRSTAFTQSASSTATIRSKLPSISNTPGTFATSNTSAAPIMHASTTRTVPSTPTIQGYAGFWHNAYDAQIMTIGVREQWQRKGVATRLMQRMIEDAQRRGVRRMKLEARVDNVPALALYQSFGFHRTALLKRYYQQQDDAYAMELDFGVYQVGFAMPA